MHKKNRFHILLFTFIIIAIVFSTAVGAASENNNHLLLLKAEHIDTEKVTEYDRETSGNTNQSFKTKSMEETEQYYIVQFIGPVKEKWKQNVTATGATIFNYVPYNAFVFRMNEDVKDQVQSMDFVQWIGEYKPSYKYESEITENTGIQLSDEELASGNIYNILLFSATDHRKVAEEIESAGGNIISDSGSILKISIQSDRIPEVAAINGINWIEKYVPITVSTDKAATIINADTIHLNYSLKGSGQIIGISDSGLDTGNTTTLHEDFLGRVRALIDLSGDGSTADLYGHGTHVAGSVLGNGSLSGGQYAGMAPEAEVVFQAIGKDNSSSLYPPDNFSIIFQQAYDLGARIHTNSWGGYANGAYTINSQQVDQFMWEHPDMLILFAAGNEGKDADGNGVIDLDSIGMPATAKNCLTVGASENYRPDIPITYGSLYSINSTIKNDSTSDTSEGMAAFSSRGPTDDGRIKPDIVAPGTFIASTRSSEGSTIGWGIIDDNYLYMGGTSMATPITAGSAAIVRQYYTDIENLSSPSAALLKATLINGAYDLTPGQYGTGDTQEISGRPDYSQGWGRVDIENSIYPQHPGIIKYYDKIPLTTDDSWEVSYDIADESETLRATLVWTDYPGAPYADVELVNNLDLIVTAPDDVYYGNGRSENNKDDINNVEGVELINPTGGTYTFKVTGTDIPQGPQNFSLVLYFVPGYNEYPQNNSYTNDNTTEVSADLISLYGINTSSISMTIDGSEVNYTLEAIDDGYRVENVTLQPYPSGQHNASVNALTNQSQQISYNWTFHEDYEAPVLSDLANTTSSSSVTLIWNQSEDTDYVEIWRNGAFTVNNSASQLTDTGLSASTAYNYSLRPMDFAGNIGNWTNMTVTTSARTTSSSGGGGGGGGSSGEDNENIELKDVLSVYAGKGEVVDFDFEDGNNDVDYIRYTSLKNAGKISVTIEILKGKSAFADSPVSGEVYRYMNIWVGKTGYATEANIDDPIIGFRVSKEWIDGNDIDASTITLNRYSDDAWGKLETKQTGSDEDYIYFESSTPGFSPFAITAEKTMTQESEEIITEQVPAGSTMQQDYATIVSEEEETDENEKLPAISIVLTIAILGITCTLIRKQQN